MKPAEKIYTSEIHNFFNIFWIMSPREKKCYDSIQEDLIARIGTFVSNSFNNVGSTLLAGTTLVAAAAAPLWVPFIGKKRRRRSSKSEEQEEFYYQHLLKVKKQH